MAGLDVLQPAAAIEQCEKHGRIAAHSAVFTKKFVDVVEEAHRLRAQGHRGKHSLQHHGQQRRAQAFATAHSIPFEESNDTIGVRDFRLVVKLPELLKVMLELNYEKIEHGTVDLYGIDEKDPLVDRAQYLTEESIVVMD